MSTVQQDERPTERAINFNVPTDFKTEIDVYLARRPGLSLREFCTRLIAEKLGIPVPGEEPAPDASTKKRRAG